MKLMIDIPDSDYRIIKQFGSIAPNKTKFLAMEIVNGTPIPDNATVCDIEQIRAEIQKRYDDCDEEWEAGERFGYWNCLQIIDKYTKGVEE